MTAVTAANSANATRLSRILRSAPSERIVARDAAASPLTLSGFLAGAALWRDAALLEKSRDAAFTHAVLYSEDAAHAAPALFGLWAAGIHVILPGDALPSTLGHIEAGGVPIAGMRLVLDAGRADPEGRAGRLAPTASDFAAFNAAPVPADLPELDDRAQLLSLLTSGSTGRPKLIVKRLEQVFWEPEAIDAGIPGGTRALGPVDVIGTVSAQHIYGLLFRIFWPLLAENAVLIGPRIHFPELLAEAILESAARGRRVALISAPAHLRRFTAPEVFEKARAHVAFVFSSTGPLDEAATRAAQAALGRFPTEVLGSTETGGIAWRTRRFREDAPDELLTPEWATVEGIEAAVRPDSAPDDDANEQVLEDEGEGVIVLRGRHLDVPGWNLGSDRIRLSAPGFVLLGRADRIVKIEGKRVALAAMERALEATGLVPSARVFPAHEPSREALAAALEPGPELMRLLLSEGKPAAVSRLRAALAAEFPAVVLPRRWRFVASLPANPQGKTTQRDLEGLLDPRRPEWLPERDETNPETGARTIALRMTAGARLEWFRGHFPGRPILPGVAQLLLVERALREFTHALEGFEPAAVRSLKFRAVTRPEMNLRLTIELPAPDPSAQAFRTAFSWSEVAPEAEPRELSTGAIEWRRAARTA